MRDHKCQHPPSPAEITTGQAQIHHQENFPGRFSLSLGWEKPALQLLCEVWSLRRQDVPEYPHRSRGTDPGAQGLVLNYAAATLCPTAPGLQRCR